MQPSQVTRRLELVIRTGALLAAVTLQCVPMAARSTECPQGLADAECLAKAGRESWGKAGLTDKPQLLYLSCSGTMQRTGEKSRSAYAHLKLRLDRPATIPVNAFTDALIEKSDVLVSAPLELSISDRYFLLVGRGETQRLSLQIDRENGVLDGTLKSTSSEQVLANYRMDCQRYVPSAAKQQF